MIVYSATKIDFMRHVQDNQISDLILASMRAGGRGGVSPNEVRSWQNSLNFMRNVLDDPAIPADAGVAVEYAIPQSSKRIDFILTGQGRAPERKETAVIIELKQWDQVACTDMDAIVATYVGGAVREVPHPSYQAWSYAALLEDFNETVQADDIQLRPCAYLHNSDSQDVRNIRYQEHLERAPVFLRHDQDVLRRFIRQHVRYGDSNDLMYRIENGRIKPSKALADHLSGLLAGNPEFILIDDQKLVYETALRLADCPPESQKQVYIVDGGPGTGKSVVAINLLVELTQREQVVQYVTKNAAPREVYASKLAGTMRKTRINNMFKGSGSYHKLEPDSFDVLVVDEAHRLNAKSGLYRNLGENQIKELIRSARTTVFFIDEAQRISLDDIGTIAEIEQWAHELGAQVSRGELQSQFRCNGSDGYLAWIDNTLQIRETANPDLNGIDYDFRVMDSPAELRDEIERLNLVNNRARMVAGYCWDWDSKKDPNAFDIEFPEYGFAAQWNLTVDGSLWIMKPHSVEQVGCIHTCQGLEVDYVGVIIGPDFLVRDGKIVTDGFARSRHDRTLHGFKGMHRDNPQRAEAIADQIIRNTYRTLMTRGAKGCFVWSVDEETNEWFRRVGSSRVAI